MPLSCLHHLRLRSVHARGMLLFMAMLIAVSLALSGRAMSPHADSPIANTESTWTLALQEGDLSIYTRPWPGSDFVAVRTEQVVNSTVSNMVAHYLDIAAFPEWVNDLKEAREITALDAQKERLVYMRMGLPWPLQDRDLMVSQYYSQHPETGVVRIMEQHAGHAIPTIDGVVRVPTTTMEMLFIPEGEQRARMIFQGHNDPGGHVPPFLVNWMIEDVFYTSMRNMKARFESPSQQPVHWIDDRFHTTGAAAR